MKSLNVRTIIFVVGVLIVATGCVSNKRHNRDVSLLQSQVNTLAAEVSRIDSQAQEAKSRGILGAFAPKKEEQPAAPENYASSTTYRTPSGFEIPGADIQRALKGAGYYDGEVDGKIGPATRDAIRAFQRDNKLKADGVCGRKTWELLKTHLASSSAIK